jgi:hypothetical protein
MKNLFVILLILANTFLSVVAQETPPNPAQAEIRQMNQEVVKLFKEKKYSEALPIAKKVVEKGEKQFGANSVEMAWFLTNLG